MILHCNYEEIQALRAGAHSVLESGAECRGVVVAAPGGLEAVEALALRLDGDLVFHTLAEVDLAALAVDAIVSCLRVEMDASVVSSHPADEGAVAAYFDFAHALSVLGRLREMRNEMGAMIEVVTGSPVDETKAREFIFPD